MATSLNISLANLIIRIQHSLVNFAVENILSSDWPQEQVVTYNVKLADSHNSMNIESGIFTAPFDGTYIFLFYAKVFCDSDSHYLFTIKNQEIGQISIHQCHNVGSDLMSGTTVVFTMQLKAGDQVGIYSRSSVLRDYVKFSGFLLSSF